MRSSAAFWVLAAFLALHAAGPFLAPHNPLLQNRDLINAAPSRAHWFGTDEFGRDTFSRYLAGGSWSVLAGAAATFVVLLISWSAGSVAGFRGGWPDHAIMRLGDLFLSLPWLYVLIGLRAVLPLQMRPRTSVALMLLVMAAVSWARPARLVRGVVLSLSQRGYVEAARGFGVPERSIVFRHLLPGTYGVLLTQALILFPRFVLAEVTLSFLGLGVGEPEPSWGGLILALKQIYLLQKYWWRLIPVCLMLPLFFSCTSAARLAERRFRASQ
jgi:ABC-type dipeptide/oligopeptide/nickel transport system permease subunit